MMMRVVELAWLAVAAVCVIETYLRWNDDRQNAYIFLLILAVAVFMYIFRKRQRIKQMNKYNQDR